MTLTGHSRRGLMTGHDASRLPPDPVQPPNHGPMPKKSTTMPGGPCLRQGPDAPWLTSKSTRGSWVPFAIPRKAADSEGRLLVPHFATLALFRELDVRTILGVQLPACPRRA